MFAGRRHERQDEPLAVRDVLDLALLGVMDLVDDDKVYALAVEERLELGLGVRLLELLVVLNEVARTFPAPAWSPRL